MVVHLMAKFVGYGIEEYIAKLDHLGLDAPKACGAAVYEGAKIVGDAIKKATQDLPAEGLVGFDEVKKQGLVDGFGIAKMRQDGGAFNVKAGFHGYNQKQTPKYPGGQPNRMIAASVEGGTSFSPKRPFVGPAIRKSRKEAEEKMKQTIEQRIKKTMEE